MNFENILVELKNNKAVSRVKWNGEGSTEKPIFIFLNGGTQGSSSDTPQTLSNLGYNSFYVSTRIDKMEITGEVIYGWTPSLEDIFATDWEVVGE